MCVSHEDVKGDNWPICNPAVGRLVFPDRCNLFVWGCVAEHFAPTSTLDIRSSSWYWITYSVCFSRLAFAISTSHIFYTFTLIPRNLPRRRIIWGYILFGLALQGSCFWPLKCLSCFSVFFFAGVLKYRDPHWTETGTQKRHRKRNQGIWGRPGSSSRLDLMSGTLSFSS